MNAAMRLGVLISYSSSRVLLPRMDLLHCLVLTELVHNALEHGVSIQGSKVDLVVTKTEEMINVEVSDDGVGLPADFSLEKTNLGLQIVKTLTQNELAGKIDFDKSKAKTVFRITIPLKQ